MQIGYRSSVITRNSGDVHYILLQNGQSMTIGKGNYVASESFESCYFLLQTCYEGINAHRGMISTISNPNADLQQHNESTSFSISHEQQGKLTPCSNIRVVVKLFIALRLVPQSVTIWYTKRWQEDGPLQFLLLVHLPQECS
jgi:hypothetical protein